MKVIGRTVRDGLLWIISHHRRKAAPSRDTSLANLSSSGNDHLIDILMPAVFLVLSGLGIAPVISSMTTITPRQSSLLSISSVEMIAFSISARLKKPSSRYFFRVLVCHHSRSLP